MPDYISEDTRILFCGLHDVGGTLNNLFDILQSQDIAPEVHLVPAPVVATIDNDSRFVVEEDHKNHDYILSAQEIATLRGKRWRAKKNFVNRFKRQYGAVCCIKRLDLCNEDVLVKMKGTFLRWAKSSKRKESSYANELRAFQRLVNNASHFEFLYSLGVWINNQLEGFSIFEKVSSDYIMIHFEKADVSFVGIFAFLHHEVAKITEQMECRFINYEQDLGIPGLAQAKKSYHPVALFSKYTIARSGYRAV